MIGAEEKRKLRERLGKDGANPLGAVLKCAVGIGVLLVIAAGPWTFLSSGRHTASQERLAAKAAAEQEESKRALDDGRRDGEIRNGGDATRTEDAKARQWGDTGRGGDK